MEFLHDEQTLSVGTSDNGVDENTGYRNIVNRRLVVLRKPINGCGKRFASSSLTTFENQPVVGEVNATDPDAGATLSYSLVSGAGDSNNNLFTLESNGTLKTR